MKKAPDDLRPLLSLLKKVNKENISYTNNYHNTFITSDKQQCTVKFRYSDSKACHSKFLNGYMVQKYKDNVKVKPQLFGNVSKEEYLKRMDNEKRNVRINGKWKTRKCSRHYKWILSPEKNLDDEVLQEYTKAFVTRLEQTTGYKFVWQAAIHRDTDHPHVHLLINGVDMNGKRIKSFSKDVIQNYAREFSEEILTNMCGNRDSELKRKARENRIVAARWTEFDTTIKQMVHTKNVDEKYLGYLNDPKSGEIKDRLIYLHSLGLADFENGKYYIKKNFEELLRTYGRYNTLRDAEKYVKNNSEIKIYKKEMGEIKGTIRHVYSMNDEDVWNNGVVLENENTGEFFFVPSFDPVRNKEGDNIKIVNRLESTDDGRRKEVTSFEKVQKVQREDGTVEYGD